MGHKDLDLALALFAVLVKGVRHAGLLNNQFNYEISNYGINAYNLRVDLIL